MISNFERKRVPIEKLYAAKNEASKYTGIHLQTRVNIYLPLVVDGHTFVYISTFRMVEYFSWRSRVSIQNLYIYIYIYIFIYIYIYIWLDTKIVLKISNILET